MASAVYAGFSFLFYVIGNNTIMFPGYKKPSGKDRSAAENPACEYPLDGANVSIGYLLSR